MQEMFLIWYTPGRRCTYATIPNTANGSSHHHIAWLPQAEGALAQVEGR
jgi:hypothetical protein